MYELFSKLVCRACVLLTHDCTFLYWAAILDLITGRCKSRTGSTWTASLCGINSDRLGSTRIVSGHEKKNIKLNEFETFTHLKVKILVKSGPNVLKPSFFILSASSSPTCLVFRVDPSWSDLDWQSELIQTDFCTCLFDNCGGLGWRKFPNPLLV